MTEPMTNAQTYKLPESARNNARQVLEWREKHGGEVNGMTEVGWRRARQLADNAEVDLDTVKKMSGFIRHEGYYKKARTRQRQEAIRRGHIRQSWLGLGGVVIAALLGLDELARRIHDRY